MRIRTQRGTSLIEVVVATGIMIALAGILMPNMARIVGDIRLRSAADSFGSLVQQARMSAVRDNKFYTVIPGNIGQAVTACIDNDWQGSCQNNIQTGLAKPNVLLPPTTNFANGGGVPNTNLITCGPVGAGGPCPAGVTGLNFTPEAPNVFPSFNARGLPCINQGARNVEPRYPGNACVTLDPGLGGGGGGQVGFLYTFQYNGVLGANYAAVAVTPAGRVTTWMYRGKDNAGNDSWSR